MDGQSSLAHVFIKDSPSHNVATSLAWKQEKKRNLSDSGSGYVVSAQGVWVICWLPFSLLVFYHFDTALLSSQKINSCILFSLDEESSKLLH